MSNVFEGRKTDDEEWFVKETRRFTDEEKSMVERVQVVDSRRYGPSLSCCFTKKTGGVTYIPMIHWVDVSVGDILDIGKCEVLTLESADRPGITIKRIDYDDDFDYDFDYLYDI